MSYGDWWCLSLSDADGLQRCLTEAAKDSLCNVKFGANSCLDGYFDGLKN